jgi:hypothetical protein
LAGTLALQAEHFRARGFELAEHAPDLFWGTVNLRLQEGLALRSPDVTLADVDWSADQPLRIAPETFSFVRCRLIYEGRDFPGLIYYPHPETKPTFTATIRLCWRSSQRRSQTCRPASRPPCCSATTPSAF